MAYAKLLGIDPGFGALGIARVELRQEYEIVSLLTTITTEKSDKKRSVRASEDNIRRIREITTKLGKFLNGISAICCETQSWPRDSGSSSKVGMAWGCIGTLAEIHGLPIVQASPQEIKRVLTGGRSATKEQVKRALERRYGKLRFPYQANMWPHASDALAAVVACLDSELIRAIRMITK